MSTTALTIQSYRKRIPVFHNESTLPPVDVSGGATIISMVDKKDVLQNRPSEIKQWNMPPLVRAYLKGRDNDPL